MNAKIKIISCITLVMLILASCEKQHIVSEPENTSELSEVSVTESVYQQKVYPEYDDIAEYNLTELNIENANLHYINYIGNDLVAVFCQEDNTGIKYYKFVNYKTGEELFRKNQSPIPHSNGFALINIGNEGLNGRINLDVYDYNGKYKESVVPDAFWLLSFSRETKSTNFSEFPLSERFTIRNTYWRLYLRDEVLNTNEVIFENTPTENYRFIYPINETQFLFCKSKGQYGIYDVTSKEIVYNESNNKLSKLGVFAVLDNKIFSLNENKSIYFTNIDNKTFGDTQELLTLPKDSYVYASKIAPDKKSILLISYKSGAEHNSESFKIDILDVHSLSVVFTKTFEINKNLETGSFHLVYLDDGTIAFSARELNGGEGDTFLYVLNVK